MPKLALTIGALARLPAWPRVKLHQAIEVQMNGRRVEIALAAVASPIGVMRYLRCPRCGRRCRSVFTSTAAGLGCRSCLRLRHPDQLVGTRWGRDVVLPVRQLRRLDARLTREGLDRVVRRRLRRRRARLLALMTRALATRRAAGLAGMAVVNGYRRLVADTDLMHAARPDQ